MLKISKMGPVNHTVVLRIEGRIVGPWVTELQHACQEILSDHRTLKLHLADVEFMDPQGVALLSSLRSRGVALVECPPFAAEQLKAAGEPSASVTSAGGSFAPDA